MSLKFTWSSLQKFNWISFALNLIGLLATIFMIIWAIHLKMSLSDHVDLMIPKVGHLWPGCLGLATIFCAPVHCFGLMCGWDLFNRRKLRRADKRPDKLMCLHVILACLSGFLVLGVCVAGSKLWGLTRRRLKNGLIKAMREYSVDKSIKLKIDRLQMELECCGSVSYRDWFYVPWMKQREKMEFMVHSFLDEDSFLQFHKKRLISTDVPYSCCSKDILQPCVHRNVLKPSDIYSYDPEEHMTISTTGCQSQVLTRTDDVGRDVVICLILLSIYQLFVLSIVSRIQQTALKSIFDQNIEGNCFVAWIFGRGPKQQRYYPVPELQELRASASKLQNCKIEQSKHLKKPKLDPPRREESEVSIRENIVKTFRDLEKRHSDVEETGGEATKSWNWFSEGPSSSDTSSVPDDKELFRKNIELKLLSSWHLHYSDASSKKSDENSDADSEEMNSADENYEYGDQADLPLLPPVPPPNGNGAYI